MHFRYRDFREGPSDPQPYALSMEYWHVLTARLAFVIVFIVSHSELNMQNLFITHTHANTHTRTHTCTHTHTPGRGENTPKFCVPRTLDCILRVSFIHVCRYTQLCFSFETVIGSLRWDPQPYTLSIEYWHVLTAHLAFFFIFTVSHSKLNMHSFISHTQLTSVKI